MTEVQLIPILSDNYVFVIVDTETKESFVVDPGEGASVIRYLEKNNLQLKGILLTHHHHDHIGGLLEIKEHFNVPAWGPFKNKDQIPGLDHLVKEGDQIPWTSAPNQERLFRIFELPGHTLGHVGFFLHAERPFLFSGDVLFGFGCGRLFEGSYEQAFQTLQIIKNFPAETQIYCTHEYTEANLRFCKSLDPELQSWTAEEFQSYAECVLNKRRESLPSVPLTLKDELKINPFLRARTVNEFKTYRELRNQFR